MNRILPLFVLLLAAITTLTAQEKKSLSHEVYDDWNAITNTKLSTDGNWIMYNLTPQDGDRILQIYNVQQERYTTFQRAESPVFSYDSKYAIFKTTHPTDSIDLLKLKKVKKEEFPKDTLVIVHLPTQNTLTIPAIKSYALPQKAGRFLAYQTEPEKKQISKNEKKTAKKEAKVNAEKKESTSNGFHLIIRNLEQGLADSFKYVMAYQFTENGEQLAILTTGIDSTDYEAGIYIYNTKTKTSQLVFSNRLGAKNITWDKSGTKLSWVANTDTSEAGKSAPLKEYGLYYWNNEKKQLHFVSKEFDLPEKWMISEHANLYFSEDGSRLFFGTAPEPLLPDTTILKEDKAVVDIWSWTDGYLQPQQLVNVDEEKKRSYLAVYHLKSEQYIQLENEGIANSRQPKGGTSRYIVGLNDKPYQKLVSWVGFPYQNDVYLIDVETGKSKLIAKQVRGSVQISPNGKYINWYEKMDSSWYVYSIQNQRFFRLNDKVTVNFYDEENDIPDEPYPYGEAGWLENDAALLVYDAYDIWSFEFSKKDFTAIRLTNGRASKVQFRNIKLDDDKPYLPDELLLEAFDKSTKAAGFYSLNARQPNSEKVLLSGDYKYGRVIKSESANRITFTRESFREFPDLWTTTLTFENPTKVSDANPQMSEYKWGTVEMTTWTSLDGVEMNGLIYKPENFDPNKKYPMLVYFYEKYSDRIHQHYAPQPLRSAVNFTYMVSNDYVLFIPDIIYKDGYPGESAYNCIMPGVQHMIDKGYVNQDRIGIQGHSWGGYQTAYLVTRTNLFRAAESGAPVSNMTSAYGGIRWTSGLSRMFQYERTQSRIGGTLWEKPMRYLENSPVFHADKIETPLLILHNDGDGAVPWYQGIELFVAMRRLDKPCWMLNYNGDGHGVTKRANKIDFAIRMYQFFDHYLKDAPAPEWMVHGVPAVEKGLNDGLQLITD